MTPAPLTPEDREAEPLDREAIAAIEAGHRGEFSLVVPLGRVGYCRSCAKAWPCSIARLVAECRRLEALVERQGEETRRLREWIEDAVLALGAVLIIAERWGISGDGINSANHQRLIGEAAELLGIAAAPETEAGAE